MNFSYDSEDDVLVVEGIRYTGDFFRVLARVPIGTLLRVEARIKDRVIIKTLKRPNKRAKLNATGKS